MALIEQVTPTVVPAISNPVADILNRAADLIERDGWFCLGVTSYSDGSGSRCALGAIADGGDRTFQDANTNAAVYSFSVFVGDHPPTWNDAPGRTKDEVIAAFRACALVESAR